MAADALMEREWIAQWRQAAGALAEVRARELAALSDAEALAAADTLLAIGARAPLPVHRRTWSGLVEFQRLLRNRR
jgi:hypothetical protein